MSEKTESPTPRRLRRARHEGDLPISGALTQSLSFLAALVVVPATLSATAASARERLHATLSQPPDDPAATWLAHEVLVLAGPLLLVAAVAATASGLVQTGAVISTRKLGFDLSRANPITGLANLWSAPRAVSILRAFLAAVVVGALALLQLRAHGAALAHVVGNLPASIALAGTAARQLAWWATLVGLSLGVVDLLVVRHTWWRRLRMSRDEIRRELREAEGDPLLRAARQRAHQELLSGATLVAVKRATVVVINPTHVAVALRYDENDDDAPVLLAQGRGELARRIVDEARAHGVPVVRDVPVARALADLEVGEQIPETLYEAVAEILREAWAEDDRLTDTAPADTP